MTEPFIRTVLGDRLEVGPGVVYAHEHLIIDSPLIADRFPQIHLFAVADAVSEASACRDAGAALFIDAMPTAAGRDAVRLAEISRQSGVDVVASTGLHHDRYYGPLHWTNRVRVEDLVTLFVDDLTIGIDEYDCTSPVLRRTQYRAGIIKVATSGAMPDARDRRNLLAAARASLITGAPILTHCEGGLGGLEQLGVLTCEGVPASSVILSHVDKAPDPDYLHALAETGAVLEFDQALRQHELGVASASVQALARLVEAGFVENLVVGTDGARRDLWSALGGSPGLAWLARELPSLLSEVGLSDDEIAQVTRENALRALRWRPSAAPV